MRQAMEQETKEQETKEAERAAHAGAVKIAAKGASPYTQGNQATRLKGRRERGGRIRRVWPQNRHPAPAPAPGGRRHRPPLPVIPARRASVAAWSQVPSVPSPHRLP